MDIYDIDQIKKLLSRHGFRFSKSMGQNFLIASEIAEGLVSHSGIGKEHGVLEIGPGIGSLTLPLGKSAGRVVSVELDRALVPILRETLSGLDNVEVMTGDILKMDIGALAGEKLAGLRPVVCANLPYNITSPVISALIEAGCFGQITVMVQREVARRMCAAAGSSDYGAFSIYVNFHTRPEILFDVPPDCFVPRPKVHSSVIRLEMRAEPPADIFDKKLFFRIVRASFAQRRKTLVNGLFSAFGDRLGKQEIAGIVTGCGFPENVRGETLDIAEFALLTESIGDRLGND